MRRAFLLMLLAMPICAQTQRDGGVGTDGAGHEVLESIHVPPIPGAPFSLQLATEWTRPLMQGGTFTVINSRPMKRDSKGRIYEERWLLAPKGTNIPSRRSYIQIYDPLVETYYECSERTHVCELLDWPAEHMAPAPPIRTESGPIPGGRGYRTREDRGMETFIGLPVHAYRDTTVINPGIMGNDSPMTYVRDLRYSETLRFNLTSILEAPGIGIQRFTVTEIVTTEPEAKWFEPPAGYRIVDKRQPAQ